MATELLIAGISTGSTIVAKIRRNTDEKIYNVVLNTFESFSNTNSTAGNYDISLTEQGSSGYFVGNFPTAITTSGVYNASYFTRSVGYNYIFEAATTINWNGTSEEAAPPDYDLVTLSDVRTFLGIEVDEYGVSDQDDFLSFCITLASGLAEGYVGRKLKAIDFSKTYLRISSNHLYTGEYPINSIESIIMDYSGSDETVDGNKFLANDAGTIRFNGEGGSFYGSYVQANFNAGYQVLPKTLKLAVLLLVQAIKNAGTEDDLISEKSVKDVKIKFDVSSISNPETAIMARSKMLFDLYRSPVGR